MRLIAYIRVSTDDQRKHGVSIGQQIERCRAYCALHEHDLVDVICDEGVSASRALATRRGGAQLLDALRDGRADGVLVNRLDRLFRDTLDGLHFFRDVIERDQATVHSIAEKIDTSSPLGKLMLTITLGFAQYDRDMDVARARETSKSLREQGRVYAGVPFGCVPRDLPIAATDGKPRRLLQRDPTTWAQRCTIVDMHERGMSLRKISDQLRKDRVSPPRGGRGWSVSTLRNLIETHGTLTHLPMANDDVPLSTSIETGVSHAHFH
ncbi:MAG: recombinase family protein [Rudaea sp.]|nr:recombinase family protein [Rudaea sp.]